MEDNETLTIKHTWNTEFVRWIYHSKIDMTSDGKNRIFNLLANACIEDPGAFLRIFCYFINKRDRKIDEEIYQVVAHFLAVTFPDLVTTNIHRFIELGKPEDVLYFMSAPNLTERVIKWVSHMADVENVKQFKELRDGKELKSGIIRKVWYKPKFNKDYYWSTFIKKILDDPAFNGLTY